MQCTVLLLTVFPCRGMVLGWPSPRQAVLGWESLVMMCWRHGLGSVQPCGAGVAPGLCTAVNQHAGLATVHRHLYQGGFCVWRSQRSGSSCCMTICASVPVLSWVQCDALQALASLLGFPFPIESSAKCVPAPRKLMPDRQLPACRVFAERDGERTSYWCGHKPLVSSLTQGKSACRALQPTSLLFLAFPADMGRGAFVLAVVRKSHLLTLIVTGFVWHFHPCVP